MSLIRKGFCVVVVAFINRAYLFRVSRCGKISLTLPYFLFMWHTNIYILYIHNAMNTSFRSLS